MGRRVTESEDELVRKSTRHGRRDPGIRGIPGKSGILRYSRNIKGGLYTYPSGKANSARCPEKEEVREEGAVRAGLLQVGLQSFLQRVFAPNEPPLSHPKRHQETLRMTPQMSQNGPKWAPSGELSCQMG